MPNESQLEGDFENLLDSAGDSVPERQVDVGSSERWIGPVDYRDGGTRIIWEIDGRTYHQQQLDAERDEVRRAELIAAGYVPVQIKSHWIKNRPEWLLNLVRESRRKHSV